VDRYSLLSKTALATLQDYLRYYKTDDVARFPEHTGETDLSYVDPEDVSGM